MVCEWIIWYIFTKATFLDVWKSNSYLPHEWTWKDGGQERVGVKGHGKKRRTKQKKRCEKRSEKKSEFYLTYFNGGKNSLKNSLGQKEHQNRRWKWSRKWFFHINFTAVPDSGWAFPLGLPGCEPESVTWSSFARIRFVAYLHELDALNRELNRELRKLAYNLVLNTLLRQLLNFIFLIINFLLMFIECIRS